MSAASTFGRIEIKDVGLSRRRNKYQVTAAKRKVNNNYRGNYFSEARFILYFGL
jgi:hypothetical protein